MTPSRRRRGWIACLGLLLSGCAPAQFEKAVSFYADDYHVADARARRCDKQWNLRFTELMISDLEDAIANPDEKELRRKTADVFRAANSMGDASALVEIDRMPPAAREKLASLADTEPDPETLRAQYQDRSKAALDALLSEVDSLTGPQLRKRLRRIRNGIQAAPDDRGRLGRQVFLAWGAAPAWVGVNAVEAKLEDQRGQKADDQFERAVVWTPPKKPATDLLYKFAPTVVIEWPQERSYPPDYDRFGTAYLTGTPNNINVSVNTSRPMIYTYTSEAKINGRRYPQLVYNWWFPKHPEMEDNDPAAGHIDGDCLRITLDSRGLPAVFEMMQSCGCGHLVFVSKRIEDAARRSLGKSASASTNGLAVTKNLAAKRDLIVVSTVDVSQDQSRPVVYVLAGYHSVSRIDCAPNEQLEKSAVEKNAYELSEYAELERLPLGRGVASMFGPDGLVHNAGRAEGYLLAPTGILSAGQPRQRGTQKIRWDTYSFDDPTLLQRALNLPEDF